MVSRNKIKIKVGDIVWMQQDKYQSPIWGFVTAICGAWANISWFDGVQSEEDIAWLNKQE
jgi:hypothetical protein